MNPADREILNHFRQIRRRTIDPADWIVSRPTPRRLDHAFLAP